MRQEVYFVVVLLLLSGTLKAWSQTLESGWKEIKPLSTDKNTVEKILGKARKDNNDYFGYRTDIAFTQVNYSTEPCQGNQFNRGKFNVPKNTVLDYSVHFHRPTRLTELKFKRGKYTRQTNAHRPDEFILLNQSDGIMIIGSVEQGLEYVGVIYFKPKKRDEAKFRCTSSSQLGNITRRERHISR
jgi:hypothetical protein